MDRIEYLKKIINEAMDETVSGFDTFKDFQKLSKRHGELHKNNFSDVKPNEDGQNGLIAYHCTGEKCKSLEDYNKLINSFRNTGIVGSREWLSGQRFGRGVYAMLKYSSIRTEYGPICIHFLIKPETVNNHFIFANESSKDIAIKRGAYLSKYAYESASAHLKRVLGDIVYKKLLHKKNYNETEDDFCKRALKDLYTYGGRSQYLNDSLMDEAGVEGYTFNYGDTAVMIRMFDCATPIRYTVVPGYHYGSLYGLQDGDIVDNEESFEQQNFFTDVYHRHRNSYPLTKEYEAVIGGLTKVSRYLTDENGKQLTYNGKNIVVTNFVNGMTGEMLFVTPLVLGNNFSTNVITNTYQFKLGKKFYKIIANLKKRKIFYFESIDGETFEEIDKKDFDRYSISYMKGVINKLKNIK